MGSSADQTRAASATAAIERFLEAQRDQLALWLPVAFGSGIAAWFVLPTVDLWLAWLAGTGAVACATVLLPEGGRTRRVVLVAGLAASLGCLVAWGRAVSVAAPVLARPVVVAFEGRVERVEQRAARKDVRVTLRPDAGFPLPSKVRVTIDLDRAPTALRRGDRLSLRARLVPPPTASVPGAFDFARIAWFQGLGATGTTLGKVVRTQASDGGPRLRDRLSDHICAQLDGSAGGIAAALATGDRGGIALADEEAMRASGLTHLLSISGLHVTAVVGATMLLTLKLLALSTRAALRLPLIVIAAGAGAGVGVAYTLLTGAEVPTVRACVAALLILVGVALGRRAFTLRLVATGAVIVLALWPESLIGPSFQLSFAAITAIVALHEWPVMQRLTGAHDEGLPMRLARGVLSLLLTGLVVEAALAPIALFHFHRQGLYGALANIVAIPLTTFVIMPLEAAALLFDAVGLGRPLWWLTGIAMDALLGLARIVASWPGAVAALPSIPPPAFAAMLAGGFWLTLTAGPVRRWGLLPFAAGAAGALAAPAPDLLVTGDGVHMAVRGDDGRLATLRPRAGEYVRSVLAERGGSLAELGDLDMLPGARCSVDLCRVTLSRGGRPWRIVATRSRYFVPTPLLLAECRAADIVVSDRRLPQSCAPRWLKADRALLARNGGLAVHFDPPTVETVADDRDQHPWVAPEILARPRRPAESGTKPIPSASQSGKQNHPTGLEAGVNRAHKGGWAEELIMLAGVSLSRRNQ